MNTEKEIRQAKENEKYVDRPVVFVVAGLILTIGCLVYFGIKNRAVLLCVRDLIISICAFLLFVIGLVLAILCFFLSNKIDDAKAAIADALKLADGKVEILAENITEIFRMILNPFLEMKSRSAGVLRVLKK